MYVDSVTAKDTLTLPTKARCPGGETPFVNFFFEITSEDGKFYSVDTLTIKVGFESLIAWGGVKSSILRD